MRTSAAIPVDVVFIVDTTGSMSPFISAAVSSLHTMLSKFENTLLSMSYSLIVYRDHPPEESSYASRILVNCKSSESIKTAVRGMDFRPHGGGDVPESGIDALYEIENLNFRNSSIRTGYVIGDAPFHGCTGSKGYSNDFRGVGICTCGKTLEHALAIIEKSSISLTGVFVGGNSHNANVFSEFCKELLCASSGTAGVDALITSLKVIQRNSEWNVGTLLPYLVKDPFKPSSDLATELSVPMIQISEGIEFLNMIGATQAFL